MHGLALALIALAPFAAPVELEKKVEEVQTRRFVLPLAINSDLKKISKIKVFISDDGGRTWTDHDVPPTDKEISVNVFRDGVYWFAIQTVMENGERLPPNLNALVPEMKVRVISNPDSQMSTAELTQKAEKLRKEVEDLQHKILEREVEGLRKQVDQLKKKLAESGDQPTP